MIVTAPAAALLERKEPGFVERLARGAECVVHYPDGSVQIEVAGEAIYLDEPIDGALLLQSEILRAAPDELDATGFATLDLLPGRSSSSGIRPSLEENWGNSAGS